MNVYTDKAVTRQLFFNTECMIHRANNAEMVLGLKPIPDNEIKRNNLRIVRIEYLINPSSHIVIGQFGADER